MHRFQDCKTLNRNNQNPNMATNETNTTSDTEQGFLSPAILFFLQFILPSSLIIVVPLGIIGNFLSIVVFIKRRNVDRVSSQYLTLLAICDLATIFFTSIPVWLFVNLEKLTNGKLVLYQDYPNNVLCIICGYMWNVSVVCSSWIVILFSLERLLVTWQPLKMGAVFSSSKPRKTALACLVVCSIAVSGGRLKWLVLGTTRVENGHTYKKCQYDSKTYPNEAQIIWYNFHSFGLGWVIPLILIIFLNFGILAGIRYNRMSDSSKSKSSNKNEQRAILNLFLISFFFVLFNTPMATMSFLMTYYDGIGWPGISAQIKADAIQLWLSVDTLVTYNYCVNCFLYTFSLKFYRDEVKKIICFCYEKTWKKTANSN